MPAFDTRPALATCRRVMVAMVLLSGLGACNKTENPLPPKTPPRPTMEGGHFFTADMQMSERPVRPAPGMM